MQTHSERYRFGTGCLRSEKRQSEETGHTFNTSYERWGFKICCHVIWMIKGFFSKRWPKLKNKRFAYLPSPYQDVVQLSAKRQGVEGFARLCRWRHWKRKRQADAVRSGRLVWWGWWKTRRQHLLALVVTINGKSNIWNRCSCKEKLLNLWVRICMPPIVTKLRQYLLAFMYKAQFHGHVQNNTTLDPIMSKTNPIHILTLYVFNVF